MIQYYFKSLKIVDGIVNDISPYSRDSSVGTPFRVRNLERLKKNNDQMLEDIKSLRTMSGEDRESWAKVYSTQAKYHETNMRKIIYEFYRRMAELIEWDNELIDMFGVDFENNLDFLKLAE